MELQKPLNLWLGAEKKRALFQNKVCSHHKLAFSFFFPIGFSGSYADELFPLEPSDSGERSGTAACTEPPCDAPSTSAQVPAEGSSEGDSVASSPQERSQPAEGAGEDTSGGCRRAEPVGGEGQEAAQAQSQPSRSNQDSDDSDDDPILIPSVRFRGQGQRYASECSVVNTTQDYKL